MNRYKMDRRSLKTRDRMDSMKIEDEENKSG